MRHCEANRFAGIRPSEHSRQTVLSDKCRNDAASGTVKNFCAGMDVLSCSTLLTAGNICGNSFRERFATDAAISASVRVSVSRQR